MPSHEPRGRNSNGYMYNRAKPWRAARRRDGHTFFIGYYATEEEAADAERIFDQGWPAGFDAWGKPKKKSVSA